MYKNYVSHWGKILAILGGKYDIQMMKIIV